MYKSLAIALAAAATIGAASAAAAADGCGGGYHRGPHGHCRPNGGAVVVAPGGALVVGRYYPGRGYWYHNRYWTHRYRHSNGYWRYR